MIIKFFREYLKSILVILILLLLCNYIVYKTISRNSNSKMMPKNVEINSRHWSNFISNKKRNYKKNKINKLRPAIAM